MRKTEKDRLGRTEGSATVERWALLHASLLGAERGIWALPYMASVLVDSGEFVTVRQIIPNLILEGVWL